MKRKLLYIIKEENFLSLAGNVSVAIFGIATFAILARTLSITELGQWVLFMALVSLTDLFRFGLTNTGLTRFFGAATPIEQKELVAATTLIGLVVTVLLALTTTLLFIFLGNLQSFLDYQMFLKWYATLAILNFPWTNAIIILQAERAYSKILFLKGINGLLFFLLVILNYYTKSFTFNELIIGSLCINFLTSGIAIAYKWSGISYLGFSTKKSINGILQFGKYTSFTIIATNLLRTADTLILGFSPLGNAAVALYSIPLKLTEILQIPLRSFTATAFPKLSKSNIQNCPDSFYQVFYSYSGALSILFIVAGIFVYAMAPFLVWVLAGDQFARQNQIDINTIITLVRILSIYSMLIPLDRMTGIALDSINKPQINAVKVFYMLLINIVGDIIAIYFFKSIELVAVASILFTLAGIHIGMRFIQSEYHLQYSKVFNAGFKFYKQLFSKLKHSYSSKLVSENE